MRVSFILPFDQERTDDREIGPRGARRLGELGLVVRDQNHEVEPQRLADLIEIGEAPRRLQVGSWAPPPGWLMALFSLNAGSDAAEELLLLLLGDRIAQIAAVGSEGEPPRAAAA